MFFNEFNNMLEVKKMGTKLRNLIYMNLFFEIGPNDALTLTRDLYIWERPYKIQGVDPSAYIFYAFSRVTPLRPFKYVLI